MVGMMWQKAATLVTLLTIALAASNPNNFKSSGNPILGDGTYFSPDSAPFVYNGTLYIIAGREEASVNVDDFIMDEWQVFKTPDPAKKEWAHYPSIIKTNDVFKWASRGRTYAAQFVPGKDGKFYLYAPVSQAKTKSKDPFGIGVAVSDAPVGPWTNLHTQSPVISQKVPAPGNDIQNIDSIILIDADGGIYICFGSFGQLRAYELEADMSTPKAATLKLVTNVPRFLEASWIMKKKNVYYLLYAGNNAGPTSPCTPTYHHDCQAYATVSSPLGHWTYRGVFLDIVSSTTPHSGTVELKGQ